MTISRPIALLPLFSLLFLAVPLTVPAQAATPGERAGAARPEVRALAESLSVGAAMLHGTLLLPEGVPAPPVALIIAGSGPTDRDGNSRMLPGENNSLRYLAEALAARGIASLRYDKRGIGESTAGVESEADVVLETFVEDAAAWSSRLAGDARFSGVILIGHSEGGLLALLAAQGVPVAKVVTLAGPGRPFGAILRDQLGRQLPPPMMATVDSMLAVLEAGGELEDVPPMLAPLFRPGIQPFMRSFLRRDPAVDIARLEVPILVLQGTTDVQSSTVDAELLAAANPRATLRLMEGMNHVLKIASGSMLEQLPTYSDPALPLAPGLADAIAAFIHGR